MLPRHIAKYGTPLAPRAPFMWQVKVSPVSTPGAGFTKCRSPVTFTAPEALAVCRTWRFSVVRLEQDAGALSWYDKVFKGSSGDNLSQCFCVTSVHNACVVFCSNKTGLRRIYQPETGCKHVRGMCYQPADADRQANQIPGHIMFRHWF